MQKVLPYIMFHHVIPYIVFYSCLMNDGNYDRLVQIVASYIMLQLIIMFDHVAIMLWCVVFLKLLKALG